MRFFELQPRFMRSLTGFSAGSESTWRLAKTSIDRNRFPVPEMLLILLREVMGFPWSGTGEKVRWTIYFDVVGQPYAIELAKFGLRLYYPQGGEASIARVLGQLEAALGKLEKSMEPYAKERIQSGNVTIANRSHQFRERYEFFRAKAQAAYRSAEKPRRSRKAANTEDGVDLSSIFAGAFNQTAKRGDGFFYSVAMVDAYFSYLEHQLVLLRAFLGTTLGTTTVADVLAARWDEKLNFVLGREVTAHKDLLSDMRRLKERIRNPFAHGGVENDGGSIYFHVPKVGAIPGNMSRTKTSAHFNWIPVDAPDHNKACEIFDSLDQVLKAGRLEWPARLAEAGVDPAWDRASMTQYRKLNRQPAAARESWLEHWGEEWARHENMDY